MIFNWVSRFIANRLNKSSNQGISTIGYKLGVITITISTAFAIVSSMVIIGFHNSLETRITSLLGNINIISQYSDQEYFDLRVLNQFKGAIHRDIAAIKSVVHKPVLIQSESLVEGVTLYGLDNTVEHTNIDKYIISGRLPNLKEQKYMNEIAVSQDLANKFNIPVGSEILICAINNNAVYRRLAVVGIYNSHLPEFDNKFAFCDIRLAQKLNGWDSNTVDCISCFIDRSTNNAKVAKSMNVLLCNTMLHAQCIEDEYLDIFEWISVLYKNAFIFILLLLIIVNTNLASIIAMQVIDRLYMIRALKAIGVKSRQQMEIFIISNVGMVCKAVLYGNIIGIGICALQYFTKVAKLNYEAYYIDYIPISWRWSIIMAIDAGILLTTLVILILTHRFVCNRKDINTYE